MIVTNTYKLKHVWCDHIRDEFQCYCCSCQQPNILIDPESLSLAPGAEAKFIVQATGYCLHFQWQKNGRDLPNDDRYCGTDTNTLRIVNVEKDDSKARYWCHVKNEIGKEFSKEAVLTVSKLVINVVDMFG